MHTRGSRHPAHTHDDSVLSAVYYTSVPGWSSPLVFQDGLTQVAQPAAEGELVVFPSALLHEVPETLKHEHDLDSEGMHKEASNNDVEPDQFRISFSYNLMKRPFS